MTVTVRDIKKVVGIPPSTIPGSFSENLGIPEETVDRFIKKPGIGIWSCAVGHSDSARYGAEGQGFLFDLENGDISVINNLAEQIGNLRSGEFWFIGFVIIASIIE